MIIRSDTIFYRIADMIEGEEILGFSFINDIGKMIQGTSVYHLKTNYIKDKCIIITMDIEDDIISKVPIPSTIEIYKYVYRRTFTSIGMEMYIPADKNGAFNKSIIIYPDNTTIVDRLN